MKAFLWICVGFLLNFSISCKKQVDTPRSSPKATGQKAQDNKIHETPDVAQDDITNQQAIDNFQQEASDWFSNPESQSKDPQTETINGLVKATQESIKNETDLTNVASNALQLKM
jgi:hypothetical protein